MKHYVLAVLIAASLIACQRTETTQTTGTATDTAATAAPAAPADAGVAGDTSGTAAAEKTHTMTGTLVSRNATNEVTIDNDEVPGGVMAKMTMAYELRGAKVDSLPRDGTRITSTLHEQNGKYWVTDVKAAQ